MKIVEEPRMIVCTSEDMISKVLFTFRQLNGFALTMDPELSCWSTGTKKFSGLMSECVRLFSRERNDPTFYEYAGTSIIVNELRKTAHANGIDELVGMANYLARISKKVVLVALAKDDGRKCVIASDKFLPLIESIQFIEKLEDALANAIE